MAAAMPPTTPPITALLTPPGALELVLVELELPSGPPSVLSVLTSVLSSVGAVLIRLESS